MRDVRFDLGTLTAKIGLEVTCTSQVADRMGISKKIVRRMARTGLSAWEADEAAIKLGYTPEEVWADWYRRVDLGSELAQLDRAQLRRLAAAQGIEVKRCATIATIVCQLQEVGA